MYILQPNKPDKNEVCQDVIACGDEDDDYSFPGNYLKMLAAMEWYDHFFLLCCVYKGHTLKDLQSFWCTLISSLTR